ncbi:uncharacterized protein JCM10292_003801 [Rhodotorula paludigena]|uniref:uncharacterized protein n=1 Tax=Rhodotorula paludigena TaxID=86838 RepID=UPI00317F2F4D
MSPPTSANNKKTGSRSTAGPGAASKKSGTTAARATSSSSTKNGKRSASAALADDDYASKRAKRSATGKKSLREEELGVGGELADEDMLDTEGDAATGDEDGEEGDGGVTRCVCGEDNEDLASGLMIQCDTCKCWQHGPCVGLWDEKECPNRYFCELCKPNLHGPGGLLRKVNRKSSAPARGASPVASSSSHPKAPHRSRESVDAAPASSFQSGEAPAGDHKPSTLGVVGASSAPSGAGGHEAVRPSISERERERLLAAAHAHAHAAGKEPKKRSTMNSRDAAYDDAIALSILEAGTAAMRARLEGRASGDEDEGEDDEDEVVEEIVIGPGRSRSKKAAGGGAKGGAKKGAAAKKGAKGKGAGRNRRSHSNPDADSPAPHEDFEPKDEGLDGGDVATAGENEEAAKPEGIDEDAGARRGEGAEAGEEDEIEVDAGETQETDRFAQEADEAGVAVEPEAAPAHHGGARAKHPNQYTYRPKNGQPAPPRAPKSPVKRSSGAHATAAAAAEQNGANGNGKTHTAPGGSSAFAGSTFGWGMPEHLKHLAFLLPSQSPAPLTLPSFLDPTAEPVTEPATKVRFPGKRVTMPEMRKRARNVLEFVTKVQLEMSERERRWELLRDVNERIREARERDHGAGGSSGTASAAASGSGSGAGGSGGSRASSTVPHPRGVGGTTPVPQDPPAASTSQLPALGLDAAALPPLPGSSAAPQRRHELELSSAVSAESAALMDALTKDVIHFQQRFFGSALP